jgi:predicted Rossmann-fold nucleotide-binding protein
MKYRIWVYGSNMQESTQAVQLAQMVGKLLARHGVIVITGACSGMPYIVAQAAKQQGAEIWGFSPERDVEAQKQAFPSDDVAVYDKLFFIPPSYDQQFFLERPLQEDNDRSVRLRYRNFLSTLHADAAIIIAGGWGTLNEFTHLLYD